MLYTQTKWSRALLMLLALTVLLALPLSAAYPKQSDYVHNADDVLSANTISALKDTNTRLLSGRGVVIAVCVTESTGDEEIGAFSRNLFKEWDIANGVLLVIDLDTEDYYAVQGMDIHDILTNDKLSEILNGYMEADFEDGNIDRGVYKTILKLDEFLTASLPAVNNGDSAEIGSASENDGEAEEEEEKETSGFVKVLSVIFKIILVLLILAVVLVGGLFIAALFNDTAMELFQTYIMGVLLGKPVNTARTNSYAYEEYREPSRSRQSRESEYYDGYGRGERQNPGAGRQQTYDPYAGYGDYSDPYAARQPRTANRPNTGRPAQNGSYQKNGNANSRNNDRGGYRVRNTAQGQNRQQQYYDDYR